MATRTRGTDDAALELEREAKLFRGLGDPSRLAILRALRAGPLNVTAIVQATGLTQSNASTHLHCLWCCGLVHKRKEGRYVYYRIRSRKVQAVLDRAAALLGDVAEHIDACHSYGGPLTDDHDDDGDGCGARD